MKLTNRSARPAEVPLYDLNQGEAFVTSGGAVYLKGNPWETDTGIVYATKLEPTSQRATIASFNRDYPVTRVRLDEIVFTEITR